MAREQSLGWQLEAFVATHVEGAVPEERSLPWVLSPLPTWLENVAFRLVWLIVIINLAGTAFGFIYYEPQLSETPLVMWPIVPVSPLATLYIGLSLASWRLGYDGRIAQILHVLAFVGCIKYGFWTVLVQTFVEDPSTLPLWLWQFLIWSHLGMVVQAFLIPRYAAFTRGAVVVGVGWYVLNDAFDYAITAFDGPHHTWLNVLWVDGELARPSPEFEMTAAFAIGLTILSAILAVTLWAVLRDRPA